MKFGYSACKSPAWPSPGHFTGQADQNPGLGKGRLIDGDIFPG
jgi:hypothetical protein